MPNFARTPECRIAHFSLKGPLPNKTSMRHHTTTLFLNNFEINLAQCPIQKFLASTGLSGKQEHSTARNDHVCDTQIQYLL